MRECSEWQLAYDNILIKAKDEDAKSHIGSGQVLAVGPHSTVAEIGNTIIYRLYSGTSHSFDGGLKIIESQDVLAIEDKAPTTKHHKLTLWAKIKNWLYRYC